MAKQLGAGSDAVSAALSFWSARGVTRMLTDDTYRLVDESDAMGECRFVAVADITKFTSIR